MDGVWALERHEEAGWVNNKDCMKRRRFAMWHLTTAEEGSIAMVLSEAFHYGINV